MRAVRDWIRAIRPGKILPRQRVALFSVQSTSVFETVRASLGGEVQVVAVAR
jgi:hypothetical protein